MANKKRIWKTQVTSSYALLMPQTLLMLLLGRGYEFGMAAAQAQLRSATGWHLLS